MANKSIFFTGAVILLALISALAFYRSVAHGAAKARLPSPRLVEAYRRWCAKYRKLYATPAELSYRLTVFDGNDKYVAESNQVYDQYLLEHNEPKVSSPMFAINEFADLSEVEFAKMYTGLKAPEKETMELSAVDEEAATAPEQKVKLSEGLGQGYQTRVRFQGTCGSCWAFTVVAVLEKFAWNTRKQQIDLSQQHLVDCDRGSNGCQGGFPNSGINFVRANDISQASSYPYRGARGGCNMGLPKVGLRGKVGANQLHAVVSGFNFNFDKRALSAGHYLGASLVGSGRLRFASKNNDIFNAAATGECGMMSNHAVTLVGGGANYVTILNSWGTGWGQGGFKHIMPCSQNILLGSMSYTYAA